MNFSLYMSYNYKIQQKCVNFEYVLEKNKIKATISKTTQSHRNYEKSLRVTYVDKSHYFQTSFFHSFLIKFYALSIYSNVCKTKLITFYSKIKVKTSNMPRQKVFLINTRTHTITHTNTQVQKYVGKEVHVYMYVFACMCRWACWHVCVGMVVWLRDLFPGYVHPGSVLLNLTTWTAVFYYNSRLTKIL